LFLKIVKKTTSPSPLSSIVDFEILPSLPLEVRWTKSLFDRSVEAGRTGFSPPPIPRRIEILKGYPLSLLFSPGFNSRTVEAGGGVEKYSTFPFLTVGRYYVSSLLPPLPLLSFLI